MLIVSHVNACNAEGLAWVDEILITGLRKGDSISDWRIEVHHSSGDDDIDIDIDHDNYNDNGNDADTSDAVEEDGNEKNAKEYGPAVYIIRKKAVSNKKKVKMREDGQGTSKATIKFFGY